MNQAQTAADAMLYTRHTETTSGIYRHLVIGSNRYPVAVVKRGDHVSPLRNGAGELLYATPGGGRATAKQLLAAAQTSH